MPPSNHYFFAVKINTDSFFLVGTARSMTMFSVFSGFFPGNVIGIKISIFPLKLKESYDGNAYKHQPIVQGVLLIDLFLE